MTCAILVFVTLLVKLKPASSRRTRLFLAGLIWSVVGAGLLSAGTLWLSRSSLGWEAPGLAAALLAGWLKGRYILAPRADANARRIELSDDTRCVGGVFSWWGWLFVPLMMAAGFGLRHSSVPRYGLGIVYVAVGTALLVSSSVSWRHWSRLGRDS